MTADIFFNVYEFIIKDIIRYTHEQSDEATPGVGGMLLASSGQDPKILLNILQSRGQTQTTNNYLIQNVNGAGVEKPFPSNREWTFPLQYIKEDKASHNYTLKGGFPAFQC